MNEQSHAVQCLLDRTQVWHMVGFGLSRGLACLSHDHEVLRKKGGLCGWGMVASEVHASDKRFFPGIISRVKSSMVWALCLLHGEKKSLWLWHCVSISHTSRKLHSGGGLGGGSDCFCFYELVQQTTEEVITTPQHAPTGCDVHHTEAGAIFCRFLCFGFFPHNPAGLDFFLSTTEGIHRRLNEVRVAAPSINELRGNLNTWNVLPHDSCLLQHRSRPVSGWPAGSWASATRSRYPAGGQRAAQPEQHRRVKWA